MKRPLEYSEIVRRSNDYYREGLLDEVRWVEIAEIPDYNEMIAAFNWADVLNMYHGRDSIAVLDCGCGIGHFPSQLQENVPLPPDVTFAYDTIDPSSYSLTEHRRKLQAPFMPRHSFNSAIEDFYPVPWIEGYELIWCMHSLYTVPRARLPGVLATLKSLLVPNGKCFIYLPKRQSAYMEIFAMHLKEVDYGQLEPYLTAEEVLEELAEQGLPSIDSVDCTIDHYIGASEPQTLAAYLNQICLRPTSITYAEWQRSPEFSRYLNAAFDHGRSAWHFKQEMSLISFS